MLVDMINCINFTFKQYRSKFVNSSEILARVILYFSYKYQDDYIINSSKLQNSVNDTELDTIVKDFYNKFRFCCPYMQSTHNFCLAEYVFASLLYNNLISKIQNVRNINTRVMNAYISINNNKPVVHHCIREREHIQEDIVKLCVKKRIPKEITKYILNFFAKIRLY